VQSDLLDHLWTDTALLVMQLNPSGVVTKTNAFTTRYVGENSVGKAFTSLLVDFTSQLDPARISEWPREKHRINLHTPSNNPVTFFMHFLPNANGLLAVGSPDIVGLEKLQSEVLHLNQDLSDLSRQLQKTNAELRSLNALKNQFLGMAAHDLRTPLAAISSFSEFLRDEVGSSLTKEHNQFIDIILDSAKRMQNMIEDFLDVTMIEAGKLSLTREPVAASVILESVRNMINLDPIRKAADRPKTRRSLRMNHSLKIK